MAPKVTTGASIRSSLEYDLASKNGEPRGEWVAGSLSGNARAMAKQAAIFRALRPDCQKAIWSVSLSLPPSDGRQTPEVWGAITQSFFKKMGIDPSKYAWAAHRHTHQNDHVHIRLCRVGSDGSLWNQERSAKRAIKACAELEVEFDLSKHDRTPAPKNRPTRAEIEISQRKGSPMSREKIQEAVDRILTNHPVGIDFDLYQSYLKAERIGVLPYAPGGQFKGVSYEFEGLKWPGSKIGREYSAGLPERGVRYGAAATAKVQAEDASAEADKETEKHADHDRAGDHARANDRAPSMLRSILRPRPKLDLDLPKTTNNIARADIGPVSKVMLLIGMAALRLSALALDALKNLISWILRKFGLMLAPAAPGSAQARTALSFEPRYIDVESRLIQEPVTPDAIETAAAELSKVAEALEKNNPDLLPAGQGRDELVASMLSDSVDVADETVDFLPGPQPNQSELDEMFSTPKTAFFRELDGLIDDALAALDRAIKAQKDAESAVENAPKLEAAEVVSARQKLTIAGKKLTARENEHWVKESEMSRLLKFTLPSLKSYCAKEIAAVQTAKAAVAVMIEKHPAKVPAHLNAALHQARIGSVQAAALVVDEQKKLLDTMKTGNAELFKVAKSRVNAFEAQAKLLANLPSTAQAQITLKCGIDAIKQIVAKRQELEEATRLEVQRDLEASWQKHVPQNNHADDADAPGR